MCHFLEIGNIYCLRINVLLTKQDNEYNDKKILIHLCNVKKDPLFNSNNNRLTFLVLRPFQRI